MQASRLIFDDTIWHRDQNRLHPVCIVRPENRAASETEGEMEGEDGVFMCVRARFLLSASEDGTRPILLNLGNVPLSSLQLDG